jgi:hypothetical protein
MTIRRTFYPPKEFDDKLDALAALLESEGWELPGISAAQLAEEAAAQRSERSEHDARRREFLALHEEFGLAQRARYQKFIAALVALRGVFRDDKVVLAKLKEFTREGGRPKKAAEEAA